jgi:hypothetical protein
MKESKTFQIVWKISIQNKNSILFFFQKKIKGKLKNLKYLNKFKVILKKLRKSLNRINEKSATFLSNSFS